MPTLILFNFQKKSIALTNISNSLPRIIKRTIYRETMYLFEENEHHIHVSFNVVVVLSPDNNYDLKKTLLMFQYFSQDFFAN